LKAFFLSALPFAGAAHFAADAQGEFWDPPALSDPSITLAQSAALLAGSNFSAPAFPSPLNYTAAGYQVVGAVVEKVTNRSWHDNFQKLIAEPLGLEATEFFSYYSTEKRPSNPLLGVGAIATVGDMERFARMLMNKGRALKGTDSWVQVLSARAVEDMMTVQPGTDRGQSRIVSQRHCVFNFLFFYFFILKYSVQPLRP
jgi:CubicO group peptidase (beta-lactamase class C family)